MVMAQTFPRDQRQGEPLTVPLDVLSSLGAGNIFSYFVVGESNPRSRWNSTSLLFGAGGASALDVELTRGAANRLDLAAGDSFRVPSDGELQFGADVVLSRGAADRLDVAAGDTLSVRTALQLRQVTANYTVDWADPAAARAVTIPDPGGTDFFVFRDMTQTLAGKTLTAPTIAATDWANANHAHTAANSGGTVALVSGNFATPSVVLGSAAAAGVATTTIRSDGTIAAFDTTAPTTSAVGDTAAVGTVAFAARRDHTHGREAFATPTIALGSAAGAGVATTPIRSDATIAAFDTTAPTTSAVGDTAAVGTVAFAARRDHTHGREAFATPGIVLGSTAAAGSAATLIRSNATIAAFDTTAPAAVDGTAAAVGTAAFAARRDHVHLLGATITNALTFSNASPIALSAATPLFDATAATANLTIITRRTAVNTGVGLTFQSFNALDALTNRLTLTSGVATAVWDFANTTISNANLTTPTVSATGWANANHAHAAANSGGQVGAGDLSGATLAAGVTASSLTSFGTIASPTFSGTLAGTYTIGGTPTITGTIAGAATFSGIITFSAASGVVISGATGNTLVVDTNTLVVDATNNNVGIGTATPITTGTTVALTVSTAEAGSGETGGFHIRGRDIVTDDFTVGLVDFWNASNRLAVIGAQRRTGNNTGDLAFSTMNAGSLTEKVRVTAAGNVGIGLTPVDFALGNGPSLQVGGAATAGEFALSSTDLAAGQILGDIVFASTGTSNANKVGAEIQARVNTTFLSTGVPNADLGFLTNDGTGAGTKMLLDINGRLGIGTSLPSTLLHVGLAGTTLGTIGIAGNTSGLVTVTVAAAAGTWTMTLPTGVPGTTGDQLSATTGGVCSWTAASSLREYKDIFGVGIPQDALDKILGTQVYRFHYRENARSSTRDFNTEYMGVMADEAPWAMHYGGGILNPINIAGYSILAFQALNSKMVLGFQAVDSRLSLLEQQVKKIADRAWPSQNGTLRQEMLRLLDEDPEFRSQVRDKLRVEV